MNRKQRRAVAGRRVGNRKGSGPFPADCRDLAVPSSRINEQFSLALKHHQGSRIMEAEMLYRQIIAADRNHFGSIYLLGVIAQQRGQSDTAIDLIGRALAIRPDYAEAHNNLGNAFKGRGRLDEAIVSYKRALSLKADYAEAHNNLGTALKAQGKLVDAVASYERALALKPDYAEAHNNVANALVDQGKANEAVARYTRALALRPDYFEAHNNLGTALTELRRPDEAIAHLERAVALKPSFAEAHNNLGNALRSQGKAIEATACYERALSLKPDYAEAHNNLGAVLQEQGMLDDSVVHYERALALKPEYAETHTNLGTLLLLKNKPDEAVAAHKRALASKPDLPEAHNNLGAALLELGKSDEAMGCHERALALNPDFAEARLALCMAQLPVLYVEESEIDRRRARYRECLAALCDDIAAQKVPRDFARAVGSSQPFYLAYQGRDDRDLQALYGSAMRRIMAERFPDAPLSSPLEPGQRVRVGIVSGFFRHHSNWKIPIKGWLGQLDRERFEVFGYHTGVETDAETELAASLCDRFIQGPLTIDAWRRAIISAAPHVLIYPEVGMDPISAQLAAQRLAPAQCNSWGHPDTSGFPTLDYYLSSDLMEPSDGDEHYTEQLIRLPNLSIYYEEPNTQPVALTREDMGLPSGATIYWCGQSLFKYLPQYDDVFPRIARQSGDCKFVFIQHHRGTAIGDVFRKRLEKSFATFGLKSDDHCLLLPRLDPRQFVAAVGQCDIVLDSIGWSGCNSTLESLTHNLPILSMSGNLMRGRHSMAILKMMGVTETIAETIDDYIRISVRLARDVSWRMQIKDKIAKSKYRVYRDRSCIVGLEDFLTRVARHPSG
jgi:predicted O-linked N-acetylglucosamine transferase (SPINDLY family)